MPSTFESDIQLCKVSQVTQKFTSGGKRKTPFKNSPITTDYGVSVGAVSQKKSKQWHISIAAIFDSWAVVIPKQQQLLYHGLPIIMCIWLSRKSESEFIFQKEANRWQCHTATFIIPSTFVCKRGRVHSLGREMQINFWWNITPNDITIATSFSPPRG